MKLKYGLLNERQEAVFYWSRISLKIADVIGLYLCVFMLCALWYWIEISLLKIEAYIGNQANLMKTTVIFDVDGTLVDTNWMHARSWVKTLSEFGVKVSEKEVLPLIGTGGEKITKRFFEPEQLGKYAEDAIKYHSENIAGIADCAKVFPGVKELLLELRKRGKKIVLATSAKKVILDSHIKNMGVKDLIDTSVSASEVKRTKPDPDIFEKALQKAGASARNSIVVGDTVWDMLAANKADIEAIAVLTGGNSRQDLKKAGALRVYADIAYLLANIDKSFLK